VWDKPLTVKTKKKSKICILVKATVILNCRQFHYFAHGHNHETSGKPKLQLPSSVETQ